MKAYRLRQLYVKSNELALKIKPGDEWTSPHETEKYHRKADKLLGYSDEEIDEFVVHMKSIGQLKETN